MIDVVETLLTKGASITAVDSNVLSPPLACAANEDVAMCLAMILSVFLATPANSKARRSICSLSSLRLSDSSFSTRLSEMGLGGGVGSGDMTGSGNDVTFTVDGSVAGNTSLTGTGNTSSGSLDRSQTNSLAVDEPSILPNAFSSDSLSSEAIAKASKVTKAVEKVGATNPTADVNHNTSNGCATNTVVPSVVASEVTVEEKNGSLE